MIREDDDFEIPYDKLIEMIQADLAWEAEQMRREDAGQDGYDL